MSPSNLDLTVFYLAVFALLLCVQITFGLQRKSYPFLLAMTTGLSLEILAYTARTLNHFDHTAMYLIPITIAPLFLSAAVYTCFLRIVEVYGTHALRIPQSTVTATCAFGSLTAFVL